MKCQNRTRHVQLNIRVSPDEKNKIDERMASVAICDFSKYARKMLLEGKIINLDLSTFHELAREISQIGNHIRHLTKIAEISGTTEQSEIEEMQEGIRNIWQLLKSRLSEIRLMS